LTDAGGLRDRGVAATSVLREKPDMVVQEGENHDQF